MTLHIDSVSKRFGQYQALDSVSLDIPKGELVALLGPSGSGKTTLLRIIAGLERPDQGKVLFDGEDATDVAPRYRQIGFVFQHYALFPHLSVFENVAFGLRVMARETRPSEELIRQRVSEILKLVRLTNLGERFPAQLSGGQRQRVALARALVNKPSVLLLDEPLAALDKKLRTAMQIELQTLQRDLGITFVLVTHDQEEALSMSDLVCVMSAGRIRQLATPQEVYDRPADLFVADFVGKTNRFSGTLEAGGTVRLGNGSALPAARDDLVPGAVTVALRPEAIRLSRGAAGTTTLEGTVTHRIFLGSAAEYSVAVDGLGDLLVTAERHSQSQNDLVAPGERVAISFDPGQTHIFPA